MSTRETFFWHWQARRLTCFNDPLRHSSGRRVRTSTQESSTIQAAKGELEACIKALEAHHKLIHVVNHLELGWQVVEVYRANELAFRGGCETP